jgi:predicted nucleic acid-binding Zn finger protein
VFAVPSFTLGGEDRKVYRVVIPTDPAVPSSCTCPAFTYGRGSGADCKHIRTVNDTLEDDGFPELLRQPEQAHPDIERMVVDAFQTGFKAGARGFVSFGQGQGGRYA